jgi:ssDNA-binding Zn-finger/Zn-ribbon topoisomerase 1
VDANERAEIERLDWLEGKREIKDVSCPQCRKSFVLRWQDSWKTARDVTTLVIRSCPSGGIYDVSIQCPHCNYNEPL